MKKGKEKRRKITFKKGKKALKMHLFGLLTQNISLNIHYIHSLYIIYRSRSRDTSPRSRPRPVEQPDLTSDLQLLQRVKARNTFIYSQITQIFLLKQFKVLGSGFMYTRISYLDGYLNT